MNQGNYTSGFRPGASPGRIAPCPDCNSSEEEHETTCPLSAAIRDIAELDESFFRRFPWMRHLERAVTAAERAELERRGFMPAPHHHMRVTMYPDNIWIHEVVAS